MSVAGPDVEVMKPADEHVMSIGTEGGACASGSTAARKQRTKAVKTQIAGNVQEHMQDYVVYRLTALEWRVV